MCYNISQCLPLLSNLTLKAKPGLPVMNTARRTITIIRITIMTMPPMPIPKPKP